MNISKILLAGRQVYLKRFYATGSKLVETTRDNDTGDNTLVSANVFLTFFLNFILLNDLTGIDIVSMARAPVNSLNTELLGALKTSLLEAQNNRSKGVILTSSLPTIFSAGLDITEMYNRDKKQLTNFWTTLQDTWLTLYSLNIPVATAINVQIFFKCYYTICDVSL